MAFTRTNLYNVKMRAAAGSVITWDEWPYSAEGRTAIVAMPGPVASSVWAVREDTGEWVCLVWAGHRGAWSVNTEHTAAAKDQRLAVVEGMARAELVRRGLAASMFGYHERFAAAVARFWAEVYPTPAEPVAEEAPAEEIAAAPVVVESVSAEQPAPVAQAAPAILGTAHLRAGATLRSDVDVLRLFVRSGVEYVEVVTTGNGVGGWALAGKRLTVRASLLLDFVPASAQPVAATPVVVEPAAVEPAAVAEDVPVVAELVSPELAAVRAELARVEAAAVANFEAYHGTAKMRGKQHQIRGDAGLRRGARFAEQIRRLRDRERALVAGAGRAPVELGVVDAAALAGVVQLRTRHGWHEVVRVNRASVTVRTGYSWTGRVDHGKIIDRRHAEAAG